MSEFYQNKFAIPAEKSHIIVDAVKTVAPEATVEISSKPRIVPDESVTNAKIKVVGVGGAGGNALNRMKESDFPDVELIAVNTDALALDRSFADYKIAIGKETTKSLGAGADPEVGRKAILEDKDEVAECLKGADMVFIAAGMGGGTGTGAAPVVAEIARSMGILTVAIVTMPFSFEGPVRRRAAKSGLALLKEQVDTIIVINNQKVLGIIDKNTTSNQAYREIDQVLCNAVRGVCSVIMQPAFINIDFHDVRRVMGNGGSAIMGIGTAEGEDRALLAAEAAITCPLLENVKKDSDPLKALKGATEVLVSISHGENFTMFELDAALNYIKEAVGCPTDDDFDDDEGNTEIIYGDYTDTELGEKVMITVIITGFKDEKATAMPAKPIYENKSEMKLDNKFEMNQTRRHETSTPRPTTNFKTLMKGEKQSAEMTMLQEELPFTGFSDQNLDVRQMHAQEEVLAPVATSALAATLQAPVTMPQMAPYGLTQQNMSTAPMMQNVVQNNPQDDTSVCPNGLDLSLPPTDYFRKKETGSMESFRAGMLGNDEF